MAERPTTIREGREMVNTTASRDGVPRRRIATAYRDGVPGDLECSGSF
jgi:hypothetical protein